MLVILAHRYDDSAQALAATWPTTQLMTPADLSVAGWAHGTSLADHGTAVVAGHVVRVNEIDAVYTRLAGVTEVDLPQIVASDRSYVAREMTAFLLSWLSSLRCPAINRPTPIGLAGPSLRLEAWVRLALKAGIPARAVHRGDVSGDGRSLSGMPLVSIQVIGRTVFSGGRHDGELEERAVTLAREADVELLTAAFAAEEPNRPLVMADPSIDTRWEPVARSALEYFGALGQHK